MVHYQPETKMAKQDYELHYKSMQVSRSYKHLKENSMFKTNRNAILKRDFSSKANRERVNMAKDEDAISEHPD